MKLFKKENGHTLLELLTVLAIIGVLLFFLWSNYLSVQRTYIRLDKKAQNLEDARVIINHLTDSFQRYEDCKIMISATDELEDASDYMAADPTDDGWRPIKEVTFKDLENPSDDVKITYDDATKVIKWVKGASVEIESEVENFKARRNEQLVDFTIEVLKEGNGVVADQTLEVSTTLSLKYMPMTPAGP